MSTVSVIIPNYNRAGIVAETIENMLQQTKPPMEIIVVDDGSTDNSLEVIKGFGNKIKLITQSNKGPGAARNAGLAVASGNYIQFMDSDDLASLNKLEVQTAALNFHQADIVYGPWVKVWLSDRQVRLMDVVLQQQPLPEERTPIEWFLTDWSMVFQQCLVRRSLLQRVGGYREDMRLFEDGDLFIRLLIAGGKLIFENKSLTLYRLDDFGKLTSSGAISIQRALDKAKFYQIILSLAEQNPTLKKAVQLPGFKRNVHIAVMDLQKGKCFDSFNHASLLQYVGKGDSYRELLQFVVNKNAGIRQRLKGHRWPACYHAGKINKLQKELVSDLGWAIIK